MIAYFKHIGWHFVFFLCLLASLLLTQLLPSYLHSVVVPDLSGLLLCFALSGHGSFFILKGGRLYFALLLHILPVNILPLRSHELLCVLNVEDGPEQHKYTPVMVTNLKTAASCAHLTRQPGFTLHSLSAGC